MEDGELMALEKTRSVRKIKPRYETSDGIWCPGVTTVIGLRNKEALVNWAFGVGKTHPELPSIRAYVDELAEIGSASHAIIAARLTGVEPDLSDFTPSTVEAAGVPVAKFEEWRRGKKIEVIAAEKAYVSDTYRYGGTIDLLARIDGQVTVLDAKTGRAIYAEMAYQLAAYANLVAECGGLRVDAVRILQIGRTGAEGFTERIWTDWSLEWSWFKAMRAVYQVERDIESASKGKVVPFRPVVVK